MATGITASSKAAYVATPNCSAFSRNRFSRPNPSSSISIFCNLWQNNLDSRATLKLSPSKTASGEFCDQSHLHFYSRIVCEKKSKTSKCRQTSLNTSLKEVVQISFEAAEANGFNTRCENLDVLVKELKALEAEVKARKRELKEKNKEMKMAVKEKKILKCDSSTESSELSKNEVCMDKMKMQSQECVEMTAGMKQKKSKCDLSSSSSESSESSDNEKEKCINKNSVSLTNSEMIKPSFTSISASFHQTENRLSRLIDCSQSIPILEKEKLDDRSVSGSYLLGVRSSVLFADVAKTGGRVEVCTGGKCRRDGSQQVLSAFQEVISATSQVLICASKCMGKCGKGPNVRVLHKDSETSNPQVCTAVSGEDAKFLLHYHFGVSPQQGIPVEAVSIRKASSICGPNDPGIAGKENLLDPSKR